ncbi:sodium:solute symporter family transporter [Granulosicoccus antarcticus]|uniref:Osmoregulated proline transporter OpuE n=1 Tax=Granulosicoccus antarcticus IMCC3135 TaxID=1192854 RepID=A0A2Z2NTA1_9GAMM|nr:sodium:solute symporter [Granulosicoccus antarcticus]ASJ74726.1 Osmoregulated proline transporter OpuE [Granulosicoccus antarcticus IMCC3135]
MNIDVVIVIGYFAMMLLCGFIAMRKLTTTADYLVADRNLPFWVFFPCLSTVILGGGSTFGSASQSYQFGMSGAWITLMFGLGVVTVGLAFAGKLAKLKVFTLSEMLERRYAHGTRYVSAIIASIYATLISVVQIIALGTILKALLGWDLSTGIIVGGMVTMVYTLIGGMIAITITDFIQFILMTLGVALLIPAGIDAAGGMAAVTAAVPEEFFSLTNISATRVLGLFLSLYLGIMIGQDIWQRIFTAKNEKVARNGSISAGLYSIGWGAAMGLCGILAFVLLPDLDSPQDALPALVMKVMPAGLSGLVLAALMSALMSTVSSTVLASATLISNDLLKPLFGFNEKKELAVSRCITALVSVLVIILSISIGDVFIALDTAYAYLSGCLFVPIMAALFWKKATWQGAISSIIISAIIVSASLVSYGAAAAETVIFGLLSSAVVMGVVSLVMGGPKASDLVEWERDRS